MYRAISTLFLLLPLAAAAQVYMWKDASGKTHYSDKPPTDAQAQTRKLAPSNSASDDTAKAAKAAADRRLDAAKQAKDDQDKAAQAEKDRAEDARRAQDCERARTNLQGLESGQIRYRMSSGGEREALDGAVREAELAEARRAVEVSCSPRPAAAKR
jgi:multidrug efflux pump subunit AcrA (membrane-fusion protein)